MCTLELKSFETDEQTSGQPTQLLLDMACLDFVPPSSVFRTFAEMLRNTKKKQRAVIIYSALVQIRNLFPPLSSEQHSNVGFSLAWRPISHPATSSDWEFFEGLLNCLLNGVQVQDAKKDDMMPLFNNVLVLKYLLDTFEIELVQQLEMCKEQETMLCQLLEHSTANSLNGLKTHDFIINTCFELVQATDETEVLLLAHLLLSQVMRLYMRPVATMFPTVLQSIYTGFNSLAEEKKFSFLEMMSDKACKASLINYILENYDASKVPKSLRPYATKPLSVYKIHYFLYLEVNQPSRRSSLRQRTKRGKPQRKTTKRRRCKRDSDSDGDYNDYDDNPKEKKEGRGRRREVGADTDDDDDEMSQMNTNVTRHPQELFVTLISHLLQSFLPLNVIPDADLELLKDALKPFIAKIRHDSLLVESSPEISLALMMMENITEFVPCSSPSASPFASKRE